MPNEVPSFAGQGVLLPTLSEAPSRGVRGNLFYLIETPIINTIRRLTWSGAITTKIE